MKSYITVHSAKGQLPVLIIGPVGCVSDSGCIRKDMPRLGSNEKFLGNSWILDINSNHLKTDPIL